MHLRMLYVSLFCIMFGAVNSANAGEYNKDESMIFGVVPQQSATRLAQVWVPLLEHISKKANRKIRFATARDIPTFEACLAKGAYDLAYMNPYHFTVFHKLSGYQAFARQVKKKLRGIIVVRKDSKFQGLDGLNGKSIAFPSPAAFGASVIPRAEMKRRNLSITPSYVKSHDSVYRSVVAGLFPAGGGVLRTYGNVPQGLKDQLRILYKTNAYTPHAFAAHSRVDDDTIKLIRQIMVATKNNDLLKPLGMKGFELAKNEDWDDVRSLKLDEGHTKIVKEDQLKCHSG